MMRYAEETYAAIVFLHNIHFVNIAIVIGVISRLHTIPAHIPLVELVTEHCASNFFRSLNSFDQW